MNDRDAPVVLVEDHGYPLISVEPYAESLHSRARRGLLYAVLGFTVGLVVGVSVVRAAPRPASAPSIPVAAQARSGASPQSSVASAVAPANRRLRGSLPQAISPVVVESRGGAPLTGIASYVGRSYGPRYLALPAGPGHRVTICGRAACVTRTSTDAGPALFLQRQGRIADLSWADFGRVCGCSPELVGLTHVTVAPAIGVPVPTLPPTDTGGKP